MIHARTERETERERGRERDRQTDRDRKTEREREPQTNRVESVTLTKADDKGRQKGRQH